MIDSARGPALILLDGEHLEREVERAWCRVRVRVGVRVRVRVRVGVRVRARVRVRVRCQG